MADEQYDSLSLVGRHEPDFSMEVNPDGNKERVDLPGVYSVGVVLNGVFNTLASFKAGGLVDADNKVQVGGGESPAVASPSGGGDS